MPVVLVIRPCCVLKIDAVCLPHLSVPVDAATHRITIDIAGVLRGWYAIAASDRPLLGDGRQVLPHLCEVYVLPVLKAQDRDALVVLNIGCQMGIGRPSVVGVLGCQEQELMGVVGSVGARVVGAVLDPVAYIDLVGRREEPADGAA